MAVQKIPAIPQDPCKAVQRKFKKRLVITHEHFLSRQGGFNRFDSSRRLIIAVFYPHHHAVLPGPVGQG